MWTQESKPPIVQMGESQARNQAKPVGQVVRFDEVLKMNFAELWEPRRPMGRAIMEARIRMKFALCATALWLLVSFVAFL